jgi:glycine cleavage system H protein
LVTTLRVLQKNPFDDGWLIKVRIADPGQLDALMDEDEYEEYKKSIKEKGEKKAKTKKGKDKAERKKKTEQKKKAVSKSKKR